MKRIFISGRYLILDKGDGLEIPFAIWSTHYDESSDNFQIENRETGREEIIPFSQVEQWYNELGDTQFTVSTLRVFLRDNTALTSVASSDNNSNNTMGIDLLGWESYADTSLTEASPLVITDGSTVTFSNAGNIIINDSAPTGSTGLYDPATNKVTPLKENDYLLMSFRFQAKATANFAYLDYSLDIGEPVLPNFPDGLILPETKTFPKGAGEEHHFNIISNGYGGGVFFNNGGIPKLSAVGGDIEVYNIEFQIAVVSKGKDSN